MNEDKTRRFSEWLATSPEDRVPKTQYALAEELGLTPPQLSALKKELELFEAPPSEVNALYDHIIKEAKKGGNAQMARLAWDMVNPDKKEIKEAEFTAEEYANISIRLREGLQEEYRQGGGSCPVCGRCKEICDEPHLDTESKYKEN